MELLLQSYDKLTVNTLGADAGEGFQDYTRNLSWQIQLSNAQKYPEFESQSLSETFYYLRRALHYMYPNQDSLSFGYRQYRNNKYIIGMSFEKMPDVNFTGYNSKMSGVTTFKLKELKEHYKQTNRLKRYLHI